MPNELSEKVYPDGTVVKLRDDTAREQISDLQVGKAECFKSSTNNTTQTINIGAISENRVFLFACGFHTTYVLELIAISANGANVVHVPIKNSSANSISNISYNASSGIATITVAENPFGYGRMTRLS